MSKLEKLKEFCKEHSDWLMTLGCVAGVVTYGGIMYVSGFKAARKMDVASLTMCTLAKPELGPMLDEALTKVQETMK